MGGCMSVRVWMCGNMALILSFSLKNVLNKLVLFQKLLSASMWLSVASHRTSTATANEITQHSCHQEFVKSPLIKMIYL